MNDVALLILRQNSTMRRLWCRECNFHFSLMLPETMRSEQVTCPGCEICGHVVPDTK